VSWRWIIATCLVAVGGTLAAMLLPTAQRSGPLFCEYRCTQDCSGHEAGYRWAQRKSLTSRHQCGGNSQSFIEGCLAYIEGCEPQ
jgi:hypothetical protein